MSVEALGTVRALDAAVEQALTRAAIYRLLGRAFGYPTASVLEELARLSALVAEQPATAPAIRDPLARLAATAREVDPGALAAEYVFLFDRQVRCPPYEGAYGDAPQMAGKSAELADIAGFYTAFGLAPAATYPDMEDHIAAELEFMSALALKEAYAVAEGHTEGLAVTREAQVGFLTDHLGRWADTFAGEVRSATPVPYYAAAADVLTTWVRAEIEALGATPRRLTTRVDLGPLGDDTLTCPTAHEEPAPHADDRSAARE